MTSDQALKIAYLCDHSPLDRNLYSGGNARMYDALRAAGAEVTVLDNGWHAAEPVRRLIEAAPDAWNLRLRWRTHLALAGIISRGVRAELAQSRYDVLFGAYAFQCLYKLRPPYPLVRAYTSDATQTVYRLSEVGQQFERKMPGGALLDTWVERCERAVFTQQDVLLWPSQWLWDEAQARYELDPDRCHMVPWGANIAPPQKPAPREVAPDGPVRLLLIGRDWFAKGGPIAFDTMQALREAGVDARLTVIGCVPPEFHRNEWVTVHPQLNKAAPEEAAIFDAELAAAHFLVQPSFESFGFAFCEASAYGLPSLCFRVGGVPVFDGRNGYALPPGSSALDFAARIRSLLAAPADYAALSLAARDEYETRLNWDSWGKTVIDLLRDRANRLAR